MLYSNVNHSLLLFFVFCLLNAAIFPAIWQRSVMEPRLYNSVINSMSIYLLGFFIFLLKIGKDSENGLWIYYQPNESRTMSYLPLPWWPTFCLCQVTSLVVSNPSPHLKMSEGCFINNIAASCGRYWDGQTNLWDWDKMINYRQSRHCGPNNCIFFRLFLQTTQGYTLTLPIKVWTDHVTFFSANRLRSVYDA